METPGLARVSAEKPEADFTGVVTFKRVSFIFIQYVCVSALQTHIYIIMRIYIYVCVFG